MINRLLHSYKCLFCYKGFSSFNYFTHPTCFKCEKWKNDKYKKEVRKWKRSSEK